MGVAVSIATFFMTLLGGLFALRLQDRLHLVLGFSAGAVIGVAFFDLIPEAISLVTPAHTVDTVLAMGGSLSGEHGVGTAKLAFVERQLGSEQVALMRRIKRALDPAGILNPGKKIPADAGATIVLETPPLEAVAAS